MRHKIHNQAREDTPDVETLLACNNLLKEHLEFLRNRLREKEEQLELCAEVISAMEDNTKQELTIDTSQISLN